MKYELVIIGPDGRSRVKVLTEAVMDHFIALGMPPEDYLHVSHGKDLQPPSQSERVSVCIWCGNTSRESPRELTYLRETLRFGNPVFPVVQYLDNPPYLQQVPEELHGMNGTTWNETDKLAGSILQAFGLTRRGRRTFISYRRKESEQIAWQLFEELSHRGHDVFLDTASIELARDVQMDLKSRLADVDLVVLLHTPKAFDSQWVYEEILDAQLRGTEVLDVRWPGVAGRTDLSLSQEFHLKDGDLLTECTFSCHNEHVPFKRARLLASRMTELLAKIESVRITSIRTRRDRVLRQMSEDASLVRLKAVYTPSGSKEIPGVPHVRISSSNGKVTKGVAFVSDGIPTATEIHNRSQLKTGKTPSRIVYDEFGVLQSDLSRLVWLNNLEPQDARNQCVRTIRLCNHLEWIKGL